METILDTEYALVEYYGEDQLVQISWKKVKQLNIEDYQNALNKALDFQEENPEKVKFYLSDIRQQGVLSPAYRKWFQEVAIPRALKNGLQAGSVIFEGNIFQKYYLNNIMNSTKKFGIKFKFFNKREDAIEWFKTL